MTMLPKTRRLWSRCGLMALTIPITLSMTGAASAVVNDNSPAQTQTYDNLAQASSQTDRWTDFSVKYQLEQTSAETVNGDNSAVASTSYCHDCGAVAIGFQVLVISRQDLANLHVSNTADRHPDSRFRRRRAASDLAGEPGFVLPDAVSRHRPAAVGRRGRRHSRLPPRPAGAPDRARAAGRLDGSHACRHAGVAVSQRFVSIAAAARAGPCT